MVKRQEYFDLLIFECVCVCMSVTYYFCMLMTEEEGGGIKS
jgi:hypothetical protein